MQSYLIFGGNLTTRLEKIRSLISGLDNNLRKWLVNRDLKNHPDILWIVSGKTIGINLTRALKYNLSIKPMMANCKICVILQAEKLTPPAQNAMLKLLEEPPKNALLFLSAPAKKQLLPTITSRCRLIHLQEKPEIEPNEEIINSQLSILNAVIQASPGKRISLAEELAKKTREEVIEFCQQFLFLGRQFLFDYFKIKARKKIKLPKGYPVLNILSRLRIISETQLALKYLKSNVNTKLVLENLFLSLPQLSDKITREGL